MSVLPNKVAKLREEWGKTQHWSHAPGRMKMPILHFHQKNLTLKTPLANNILKMSHLIQSPPQSSEVVYRSLTRGSTVMWLREVD